MIRLDLNRKERWIDVLPGVRLLVRPMGSAIWQGARFAVLAEVASREDADEAAVAAAIESRDVGGMEANLTVAVAQRAIIEWAGVGDEAGTPILPTAAAIAALLDVDEAYRAFKALYVDPWWQVLDEKKGSAPPPNGTSTVEPNTAETASATDPIVSTSRTAP